MILFYFKEYSNIRTWPTFTDTAALVLPDKQLKTTGMMGDEVHIDDDKSVSKAVQLFTTALGLFNIIIIMILQLYCSCINGKLISLRFILLAK